MAANDSHTKLTICDDINTENPINIGDAEGCR